MTIKTEGTKSGDCWLERLERLPVGAKVRLTSDVERFADGNLGFNSLFPSIVAPEGSVGTVTASELEVFAVRLDVTLAGAETWDNTISWYPEDDDETWAPPVVLAEADIWDLIDAEEFNPNEMPDHLLPSH